MAAPDSGKEVANKKSRGKHAHKEFEERVADFGQEMGVIGARMAERFDKHTDKYDTWFHRTFGVVGPLLSSVFGILAIVAFSWLLSYFSTLFGSSILFDLHNFLYVNLERLFIILIIFSYTSYLARYHRAIYLPLSPISTALGISIFFWIVSGAISAVNVYGESQFLSVLTYIINQNLFLIFMFLVFFGYLLLVLRALVDVTRPKETPEAISSRFGSRQLVESSYDRKRLYRSGKDKVLGGVCGGIGEYLDIDPVLIRLLWIASIFFWGTGLLLYVIAWIIIPRNPRDKW